MVKQSLSSELTRAARKRFPYDTYVNKRRFCGKKLKGRLKGQLTAHKKKKKKKTLLFSVDAITRGKPLSHSPSINHRHSLSLSLSLALALALWV